MQVFIVNGNPRAGKDTFVDMVRAWSRRDFAFAGASYSAIDPVRNALDHIGLDYSRKDEHDRRLFQEIGDALERHSSFKSRSCVNFVLAKRQQCNAIFLYIRDIHVMTTVGAMLADEATGLRPITVRRIVVTRPCASALTSNPADAGVNHILYDIEIRNDAGLEELDRAAWRFAARIQNGTLPLSSTPRKVTTVISASDCVPHARRKEAA